MESNYIHPNFSPSDNQEYIDVVNAIRMKCSKMKSGDTLYITQEEYDILEDAAHETMKGQGHQCYGVFLEIKKEE
jgi:hypothetical protein